MTTNDERVLVLMPTARDGERMARVLGAAGLGCTVCRDADELRHEIDMGAGVALLTEEGIEADQDGRLRAALDGQPPWSDFPLVVLARQGVERRAAAIREELYTTLVERPVKVRSLLSVVRAALRSRRRQYEVRDHLKERARLAAIVESSDDAIISLSLDGTITSWNAGAERLYGFTATEAVGRSVTILIPPERLDDEFVILERISHGELARHFETIRLTKDGGRVEVSLTVSPLRDVAGRVAGASMVARDITDRKRAEAELGKQTERMRLLWEAASVLLTTEEPDAMMRGLFARIAPHFGLDAYFNFVVTETGDALRLESCLGVPDGVIDSIRRLDFGQAVCGHVARTREPHTATQIQQSDDPRVQLVKGLGLQSYACNPLLADGRLLGTLSFASRTRETFDADELEFLRTVSRYVSAAYERLRLVRELRAADRKKDDFIALLAHELRNPLAPIRNGLQVLRLANGDSGAGDRARERMDRQLTHMVRLVDDLLDVSRISRNKMDLRKSQVTLDEVVASAIETAQPALDAAGHQLTISLPPDPVLLDADLTRLAQVFSNLLTNCAKYTPPGGRVSLNAKRRGERVTVAVRDNGIGIPAASLPTIFDMFSQVDRSIERTTGGLGIGLALVKGLTEMHGGTVRAESNGRGSTFTVTLPVLGPRGLARPEIPPPSANGSVHRILVVDDNRDGAESLAEMLELLGNEVRAAHDGVEALERAEEFRPDVILMDVGMPRLNGYEATRRIREREWGRGMVIIALTGWGQDSDRELSRDAGCDDHLVKPVSLPDLTRKLDELAVHRR